MGIDGARSATRRVVNAAIVAGALLCLVGCTFLPAEFNMSPIYRHRLNEQGEVMELDILWPLIHYETRPDGGSDFRIRPFYRRVVKPDAVPNPEPDAPPDPALDGMAEDHQFLWPLGRVRLGSNETAARLFPIWNYQSRPSQDGGRESDWYFLFPFFWGGSGGKDGEESYFGMFPIYLDAPGQVLTYDRLTFVLWPLYVRTQKDGRVGHVFLWPFLGFSTVSKENQTRWARVLPLFNYIARPGEFARYAVLWPFLSWSRENLDTEDPVKGFAFWPLFSRQWSESGRISGWSFLWPFFEGKKIGDDYKRLDLFWPFYRSERDTRGDKDFTRWWLWPFVSRTHGKRQKAWSILWPLIWLREYDDPEGKMTQTWVLPFYWHTHRTRAEDGGEDDQLRLWPVWFHERRHDETGEWRFPALWPYSHNNAEGVQEAYGWLWTLAQKKQRAADDEAFQLPAHLYTTRKRGKKVQTSVPFLFSYEGDDDTGTLRLFQFIPISFGSKTSPGETDNSK